MPDIAGSYLDIRTAAIDRSPIRGLTHTFYRYPARFSPAFARAAIQTFSNPGDIVFDPFMGGATTVVEAMALGRRVIGSDINELSAFLAEVKITGLRAEERKAIRHWAVHVVPKLRCSETGGDALLHVPRNLNLPVFRGLRKTIAQCIVALEATLPTQASRRFARCVLLNVGQWALNGRRRIPAPAEFRNRVHACTKDMLSGISELERALRKLPTKPVPPLIRQNDAEHLDKDPTILALSPVDLVVTSPPYPGIHMLYHRWQVDGRKETDAPFWIAARSDGAGASHYNFADRREEAEDRYFAKAERSFAAIRRVMRTGAYLVQLIAFAEPSRQLRRYLAMMERTGFCERREKYQQRTWRDVPSRRWHANFKGDLASSKEVVLVHIAT